MAIVIAALLPVFLLIVLGAGALSVRPCHEEKEGVVG
jgi:hypothetical protein